MPLKQTSAFLDFLHFPFSMADQAQLIVKC